MTNQALKVLILVHHFPPTFKGGAEWRAHRTATWLQQQGHTVRIICVDAVDDTQTDSLRYTDEVYDDLSVQRLFLNLDNAPNRSQWEYDNPWIGAHLTDVLDEFQPDLVHLISGYLMTAAAIQAVKQRATPLVATLTDFWFVCPRHTLQRTNGQLCPENTPLDCVRCDLELQRRFRLPAQKIPKVADLFWQGAKILPPVANKISQIEQRQQVLREALQMIDVAICPSNFLREMYQKRGFAAKAMRFIRQGLKHLPEHPPQKSDSATLRVGYIGGIAAHKGVQVLIEALQQLPNSEIGLKLYGDTTKFPDFYAELQAKTAADQRVQFMGTFSNQQIGAVHADLDLLVVPSTWYENSPNVILEAFAYRTPVITADLGGMAELVSHDETGLLFKPSDAADLAEKLAYANNRDRLRQWQANIQPPKSLETEMSELFAVYQTVLR